MRTPASVEEAALMARDFYLYGNAYMDADGRRVHPHDVIADSDGYAIDAQGRLYFPYPPKDSASGRA